MKKLIIFIGLLISIYSVGQNYYYYYDSIISIDPIYDCKLMKMDSSEHRNFLNYIGDSSTIVVEDLIKDYYSIHTGVDYNLFCRAINFFNISDTISAYKLTNNDTVFLTNEVFVRCYDSVNIDKLLLDLRMFSSDSITEIKCVNNLLHTYLVTYEVSQPVSTANMIHNSGEYIYCAPAFISSAKMSSDYFTDQWGLNNTGQHGGTVGYDIRAVKAWDISEGLSTIKVAIIDQGVDLNHYDLIGNLVQGYDATDCDSGDNGSYGNENAHGTACAGIVAASDNNVGVKGVSSGCKIIPIRAMYKETLYASNVITYSSWLQDAINKAWDTYNADVLSCSWQTSPPQQVIDDELWLASLAGRNGKGSVIVFSAGNGNVSGIDYPSDLEWVTAVGAMNQCGERVSPSSCDTETGGSKYGVGLDVVAPGVLIPTTDIQSDKGYNNKIEIHPNAGGTLVENDYSNFGYTIWFNGTSAACPHVAGIAALVLSVNQNLTGFQVKKIIESTCTKLPNYTYTVNSLQPNGTWNNQVGHGLVNAHKSVLKGFYYGHSIVGETNIQACSSNTTTYALNLLTMANNTTRTWSTSDNLEIVSGQGTESISVNVNGVGDAWVSVTFAHDGETVTKSIDIDITGYNGIGYHDFTSDGDETFSSDFALSGIFTVEYPDEITITSNVSCFANAKIIVEPGAKLTLNGATLTNLCSGAMWSGIQVLGDYNEIQTAANQGTLVITNNSLIEHAECAVKVGDGTNTDEDGGIIQAVNSTFKNNLRAVEMNPYINYNAIGNECSNVSYFRKCTFTLNNDNVLSQNGKTFHAHVYLWGVNRISFKGCNFYNGTSYPTAGTLRGRGVYALSAGFLINEYCSGAYNIATCECVGTETPSVFIGFYYGVYASNSGSNYTFTVDNSEFKNNYRSIYCNGVNNFKVIRSAFDMSNDYFTSNYLYGMHVYNSSGYTIEENNFYTRYQSVPSGPYGINVYNSGIDENIIYHNTFYKLYRAIYATGTNGTSSSPYTGLQFQCNSFRHNLSDIYCTGLVRPDQGNRSKGADNEFTSSINYNFYSTVNQSIDYYCSSALLAPVGISSNVSIDGPTPANTCASTICTGNNIGIITKKSTAAQTEETIDELEYYVNLREQYDSLLFDFNENAYEHIIQNVPDNSNNQMYQNAILHLHNLNKLSFEMKEVGDKNLNEIVCDTLIFDNENLVEWLNEINTPVAKYDLINNLYENDDHAAASNLLSQLPVMFEFDDAQTVEYENYTNFYNFRDRIYQDNRNWNQLTEDEISELVYIAEYVAGFSSSMAQGILCFFYKICYEPEEEMENPELKGASSRENLNERENDNSVFVYPNPAKDKLNIVINSTDELYYSIKIVDIAGKIIFEGMLNQTENVIDITEFSPGVYFYTINDDQHLISNGKFVKD